MTYEQALQLFRKGRLREIVDSTRDSSQQSDTTLQSFLAYAAALTGERAIAVSLLDVAARHTTARVRVHIEEARGLISWRAGNLDEAWKHLNLALAAAIDAKEPEWIGWAHLHLLRFTVDAKPIDALNIILPRARTAVTRAGIPALTAYLHTSVATMEGGRGHLDEGWRHCDIAESLLCSEPNEWVLGTCHVTRGAIASFRCEFDKADVYFRSAIELAEINGSKRMRLGAELNRGFLELITGQYEKAERRLKHILATASGELNGDASDFLARVYLAVSQLDECAATLSGLDVGSDSIKYAAYQTRWMGITKAKLLLKQRRFEEAVRWLSLLERRSLEQRDLPCNAAAHLLSAQASYRLENRRACTQHFLKSESAGARQTMDFQGQFHYTLGTIVGAEAPRLAKLLKDRASRIWEHQGVVSVRAEIEDGLIGTTAASGAQALKAAEKFEDIAVVVNSLTAAFDVAFSPRLLGSELAHVLEMAHCSSRVSIADTVEASPDGPDSSGRRMTLRLGDSTRVGKSVVLSCDIPTPATKAALLSDIFRIGRAAIALEKARREERSRAALWPSDPIEDQAGALFLAEEMQALLDTARRVATANIPVLITGETGTGKEVLARLIHGYSPRAAKTFLPFNCSATPREMLDSQLFGHRKGAFTGATENFAGVIRAAAGGTLFLDEIGESTLDIQPKLLRFLESGEVHPIGDTHPQRVDVRVVAATNADVDGLVAQGRFREDLFYRLNIVRLQIPPLRERRVEIPAFANHYLQKYAKEMGKGELRLAEETMEYLVLYRWPGNVRQLANEMRRLAALAETGAVLMPEHLSADIAASRRTVPASDRTLQPTEIVVRVDQPYGAAMQHLERAMVHYALTKTGSVDEAARLLGVSRKGLYLKRLRYGMEIDRGRTA